MDLLQSVRKQGSRGGRSEFTWSEVASSTHRENYLGHSLMAPVGRWQRGKDLQWYASAKNKDGEEVEMSEEEKRREELRKVKEKEEDEMRKVMGLEPLDRENANLVPVAVRREVGSGAMEMPEDGVRNGEKRKRSRSRDREKQKHRRSGRDRSRSRSRNRDRERRRHGDERSGRRDRDRDQDRERHRRRSPRERSRDRPRDGKERRRSRSPGFVRRERRH